MVIDVEIGAEVDPVEERFHVGERHDADAALARLAQAPGDDPGRGPISVGRSKATLRPVPPASSRAR
jgi:hypothetical protein